MVGRFGIEDDHDHGDDEGRHRETAHHDVVTDGLIEQPPREE
jgi:hypothetical protein